MNINESQVLKEIIFLKRPFSVVETIKEIVKKSKKAFKIKSNIKTHEYNSIVVGF